MPDDERPPSPERVQQSEDDLRGMVLLAQALARGEIVTCRYITDRALILGLARTVVHLAERTEK